MLKRLCIGVAFLAVVACGGGGGDGGSDGTTGPTGKEPVGPQKVELAPGDSKTIQASVGDVIEVHYSQATNQFSSGAPTGETCHKTISMVTGGYVLTLGDFTKCTLDLGFKAGGTAHLEIVPL